MELSRHRALPAREMYSIVRARFPQSVCRLREIYNDRQRIRFLELDGKTPSQAFIGHLQSAGLKHSVKYSESPEGPKIEAVFWTYEWCETMWKQVLGMDNTYKTNRFKMYLQVTGVIDQQSVANFAYGLTNSEKTESYLWLCQQLDNLRIQVGAPPPTVVITDYEEALKRALYTVFPQAQPIQITLLMRCSRTGNPLSIPKLKKSFKSYGRLLS